MRDHTWLYAHQGTLLTVCVPFTAYRRGRVYTQSIADLTCMPEPFAQASQTSAAGTSRDFDSSCCLRRAVTPEDARLMVFGRYGYNRGAMRYRATSMWDIRSIWNIIFRPIVIDNAVSDTSETFPGTGKIPDDSRTLASATAYTRLSSPKWCPAVSFFQTFCGNRCTSASVLARFVFGVYSFTQNK